MIELDLFYMTVSAAIREAQAEYLKKQKRLPVERTLPEVQEVSAESYANFSFWKKLVYRRSLKRQYKRLKRVIKAQKPPIEDKLTRGYNAGIEMALSVIKREFTLFVRKLEKEE